MIGEQKMTPYGRVMTWAEIVEVSKSGEPLRFVPHLGVGAAYLGLPDVPAMTTTVMLPVAIYDALPDQGAAMDPMIEAETKLPVLGIALVDGGPQRYVPLMVAD